MNEERLVNSRPDRELWKKLITPGDFSIVPYEDSCCRIRLADVTCTKDGEPRDIEAESRVFSTSFDGNVLIGNSDSFLDKDFELILQQMCSGETAETRMVYRDGNNELVKEIRCKVTLNEVTEEQLISDWGWERLYEAATAHKDRGVELVTEKRIADAFRKFSKALKLLIAVEPINPEVIHEDSVQQMIDMKVKLYNNLAHCQLQYSEYEAAIQLCNKALQYHPDSVKALYRRAIARTHLHMYEEAWTDIQRVVQLDPNDKAAQQRANELRPKIEQINKEYSTVIKKMFGYVSGLIFGHPNSCIHAPTTYCWAQNTHFPQVPLRSPKYR